MSRVASNPVTLPKGVEVTINDGAVKVKGAKGELALALTDGIQANQEDGSIVFTYSSDGVKAMAGTTRALVSNMVKGVSEGWEKKLVLNGVGYRAKASGNTVNLTVGLSHPVDFELPEGVSAETPTQTEIVVKGVDKQVVGEVAAKIRSFRPPEPYKGKGIRYADEYVRRKEAKKK
jgi:large subunit ribosomal protein L6